MVALPGRDNADGEAWRCRWDCNACDGLGHVKDLGLVGNVWRECPCCHGRCRLEMTYSGIGPVARHKSQ